MGYLKIYLNIWILKKRNLVGWWANPLNPPPVVGWAGLQNFWLTRKWAGLGSFILNPTRGEPTRVSQVGSLWHVYQPIIRKHRLIQPTLSISLRQRNPSLKLPDLVWVRLQQWARRGLTQASPARSDEIALT